MLRLEEGVDCLNQGVIGEQDNTGWFRLIGTAGFDPASVFLSKLQETGNPASQRDQMFLISTQKRFPFTDQPASF
jgi:hypothetical protein